MPMNELPGTLVFANHEEPGIRRRRAGRGFSYLDRDGRRVTDPATPPFIRLRKEELEDGSSPQAQKTVESVCGGGRKGRFSSIATSAGGS